MPLSRKQLFTVIERMPLGKSPEMDLMKHFLLHRFTEVAYESKTYISGKV